MAKYLEVILCGPNLPPRLRDLPNPPQVLHVRGELPRGPAVTIVGTRYPSREGKAYARALAGKLAAAGVTILSGGAEGIDAQAHRGALEAGGVTVVVAPSGWRRPSPKQHRRLFHQAVRRGGAHVSLVGSAEPASKITYFPRNAVLAALAHVVVVIEAPFKSGARNTAATARKLGRPLFVCAAPPWSSTGLGCLLELRLGARPLTSVKDILRELAEQRVHPVAAGPAPKPETDLQLTFQDVGPERGEKSHSCNQPPPATLLIETIRAGAVYPDDLCARTGLAAQEVQELLLTLRLDGVLVCDSSGRVALIKS